MPARLIERSADSAFELELNSTRLLLDFSSPPHRALLRYVPSFRPPPSSSSNTAALGDGDPGAPPWRCVNVGGHWLVAGEARLELPAIESLDLAGLDAVLISSAEAMLTLPYLTEHTAFRGAVLATAAAAQLGRLGMLELIALREQLIGGFGAGMAPSKQPTDEERMPSSVPPQVADEIWELLSRSRTLYSRADIDACLSKVRTLSYGEIATLDTGCRVMPECSGCGIGSAHWRIEEAHDETVVYLSAGLLPPTPPTTTQPPQQTESTIDIVRRADAAACATRPMLLEKGTLSHAEALLLTRIRPERDDGASLESPSSAMERACEACVTTCGNGGSALIPCNIWSGCTLSLIEAILASLASNHLSSIQLHVLSPIGSTCASHTELLTEWLDHARCMKAYMPSTTFDFETLIAAKRLIFSSRLDELTEPIQKPAIVLASHPSLRLGDAPNLLHYWKSEANSTLLLTTPCSDEDLLLAPFKPMSINIVRCHIDPRLGPSEAASLLTSLSPKRLILPSHPSADFSSTQRSKKRPRAAAVSAGSSASSGSGSSTNVLEGGLDPYASLLSPPPSHKWLISRLKPYEPLELQTSTGYEVAHLPMQSAANVNMSEVLDGVNAGRFTGYLRFDERLHQLRLLPDDWVEPGHTPTEDEQARIAARLERNTAFGEEVNHFGSVEASRLLADLSSRGVDARMRDGGSDALTTIELTGAPFESGGSWSIELRHGESTVVADCSGEEELPPDYDERLAMLQEVLELQLVVI